MVARVEVVPNGVEITGAPDLIVQMLDKLIDNAVDFSAEGATIVVKLHAEPSWAELSVANPGPPLPPEAATDEVVAVWTSGAAGDQNPVSLARGSDFTMVDALGKMLGEQAVRAAAAVQTSENARIWG